MNCLVLEPTSTLDAGCPRARHCGGDKSSIETFSYSLKSFRGVMEVIRQGITIGVIKKGILGV